MNDVLSIVNIFATLLVGSIAFLLYRKRKDDDIRDSAAIIKLEIDNADKVLAQIKRGTISGEDFVHTKVISETVNTWEMHRHKFINYLTPAEFSLVDSYFRDLRFLDRAIKRYQNNISDQISTKANRIQEKLVDFIHKEHMKSATDLIDEINLLWPKYNLHSGLFQPANITNTIETISSSIGLMSGTTAYSKLEALSNK